MKQTIVARLLRVLLVACCVAVVLVVVVNGAGLGFGSGQFMVLLPFIAVALGAAGLGMVLPRIDRAVARLTHHHEVTPYSALAQAATRIRAGSLEQALPGLAEVLAGGTGATRAVLWLAVDNRLVNAAQYPPSPVRPGIEGAGGYETVENLAVLLARPGTDHVVPVLDGTVLRAALAIEKPGAAITPADQLLMQDVANGAGLLLRGVALNAELAEQVRRADDLAAELQGSRQRLARAREVERRRLVMELSHATTDRLAALRAEVAAAGANLSARPEDGAAAQQGLARARIGLDELLDRFRVIARGVYPAVLRDQGPAGALEEVAADLPRPVRLTGGLARRLAWEIESGIYYVAVSAIQELAGRPAERELSVHLELANGRVSVLIEDPTPTVTAQHLRTMLADDVERLAALGGDMNLTGPSAADQEKPDEPGGGGESGSGGDRVGEVCSSGPVALLAWLPERLEPVVERASAEQLRSG